MLWLGERSCRLSRPGQQRSFGEMPTDTISRDTPHNRLRRRSQRLRDASAQIDLNVRSDKASGGWIVMLDTHIRIQLKSILFPTDFSSAGNAALPYALEIARRYGAKLYSLHVVTSDSYVITAPETRPILAKRALREANRKAQELLSHVEGVETEVLVRSGDIWTAVADVIETYKIDLTVLGTHGRTGWGKVLLGSVAETIFRKASCPVITVGPHCATDPKQSVDFHHIVFATNFSPESFVAAPYAVSLAQENQAKLTLLHVVEEPGSGLGNPDQLVPPELPMLCRIIPAEARLWCDPEFLVEEGFAANKILEIAAQKNADLIVIGVHPPHGPLHADAHLPMTTAHQIVSQAPCPVLTVRGNDGLTESRSMVEEHPAVNVATKWQLARSGDGMLKG
jgi:nucleotide-binding universal stress UspA family protein